VIVYNAASSHYGDTLSQLLGIPVAFVSMQMMAASSLASNESSDAPTTAWLIGMGLGGAHRTSVRGGCA
jgi:hypothetical protein